MTRPFDSSLIGSWLFVRSSHPEFTPRIVYHFTATQKCYWELDMGEKRGLSRFGYELVGDTLILRWADGSERSYVLSVEEDGSVMVPSPSGEQWWMVRLDAPPPYLDAFVDPDGELLMLKTDR